MKELLICVGVFFLTLSVCEAQPVVPLPNQVNFGMISGGSLPGPQSVSIGAGTQTWTTQDNNPWADITGGSWANGVMSFPASATAFTVVPSDGMVGRPVGTYTQPVTITRGTSTVVLNVTLTVTPTGPSSIRTIQYTEPSTNEDNTVLDDLAAIRLYYTLGGGSEIIVNFPPSSPTGGRAMTQTFSVAAVSGTLNYAISAIDTSGNESPRTAGPPFTFGTIVAPDKGIVTTTTVVQ